MQEVMQFLEAFSANRPRVVYEAKVDWGGELQYSWTVYVHEPQVYVARADNFADAAGQVKQMLAYAEKEMINPMGRRALESDKWL